MACTSSISIAPPAWITFVTYSFGFTTDEISVALCSAAAKALLEKSLV